MEDKQFSYTLKSVKKNIAFELANKTYTREEVKKLLQNICVTIDFAMGFKGITDEDLKND